MDDLSGISLHIAGEQEACAGQLLLTRSLVTLIFLIISSSIFAQKFSFVIADSTGVAIPYVFVELSSDDGSGSFTFITDSTGVASLPIMAPGNYSISFSHQAFLPKTVSIGLLKSIPDTITLENNPAYIQSAVIVENRVQYYSNRIVVSSIDKRIAEGKAISEVLDFLPGLRREESGIRIFGRSCSLIFLNGRPLKNRAELDLISANDIARIEIVPLAGSKYSSSTDSGVLRIWLKAIAFNTFRLDLSSSARYGKDIVSENSDLSLGYRFKKLSINNFTDFSLSKNNDCYDRVSFYPLINRLIESSSRSVQKSRLLTNELSLVYDLNNDKNIGLYIRYSPERILTNSTNTSTNSSYIGDNERINGEFQAYLSYLSSTDQSGSTFSASGDIIISSPRSYLPYQITSKQENQTIEEGFFEDQTKEKTKQLLLQADRELKLSKEASLNYGIGSSYLVSSNCFKHIGSPNMATETNSLFDITNLTAYSEYEYSSGRSSFNAGLRVEWNHLNTSIGGIKSSKGYFRPFPTIGYSFTLDKTKGRYLSASYSRKGGELPYEYMSPAIVKHNEYSYSKGNANLGPNDLNTMLLIFQINDKWGITYSLSSRNKRIEQNTYLDNSNPLIKYTIPENTGKSLFQQVYLEGKNLRLTDFWTINMDVYGERNILYNSLLGKRDKYGAGYYLSSIFDLGKDISISLNSNGETGKYWSYQQFYKGVWYSRASIQKYFSNRNLVLSLTCHGLFYRTREIETTAADYSNITKYNTDQKVVVLGVRWNFKTGKGDRVKKASANQSRKYASYLD